MLPDGAPFVGTAARDVLLDGIECSDMFEGFAIGAGPGVASS